MGLAFHWTFGVDVPIRSIEVTTDHVGAVFEEVVCLKNAAGCSSILFGNVHDFGCRVDGDSANSAEA